MNKSVPWLIAGLSLAVAVVTVVTTVPERMGPLTGQLLPPDNLNPLTRCMNMDVTKDGVVTVTDMNNVRLYLADATTLRNCRVTSSSSSSQSTRSSSSWSVYIDTCPPFCPPGGSSGSSGGTSSGGGISSSSSSSTSGHQDCWCNGTIRQCPCPGGSSSGGF